MDAITKARMFVSRVGSGSVRRMYSLAHEVGEETGRPTQIVFLDMGWCIFRYGIGYTEYKEYRFSGKSASLRKTFITMDHNIALTRELCDSSTKPIFSDKTVMLRRFAPSVHRDWVDAREVGESGVERFCKEHDVVFAKVVDSFGGQGVERFDTSDIEDFHAFYEQRIEKGQHLFEEAIVQHPKMDSLNPSSINTLRMCTVLADGEPKLVYSMLRIGVDGSCVDNATSGGIYTWVDPDGVLRYPCTCDKTCRYYTSHPTTGVEFVGFEIPHYGECVAFVLGLAASEPSMGYVGWDVAITPDGPTLVEVNNIPGYHIAQNSAWHPNGEGALPMFEKVLGRKVPK